MSQGDVGMCLGLQQWLSVFKRAHPISVATIYHYDSKFRLCFQKVPMLKYPETETPGDLEAVYFII